MYPGMANRRKQKRKPAKRGSAATKLIWLALRNITAKWARTSPYWRPAMNQFAILYEGRFPPANA
jgi:transposase-like protein